MSKIVGVTVGTPLSPRSIKEKLKLVTSVNGATADENGNVEVAGGVTSWNDLTDKPFGEEVTEREGVITFNGIIGNRLNIAIDSKTSAVKITSRVLSEDELLGSTIKLVGYQNNTLTVAAENITSQPLPEAGLEIAVIDNRNNLFLIILTEDFSPAGASKGTYFILKNDGGTLKFTESISCLTEKIETIKTLDEKYIPDTIARTSDIPDIPPAGGSGVTSWNDLTDKPFGMEMTGSDTLSFGEYPPLGEVVDMLKWSNNAPSDDDFAAGAELYYDADGNSRRYSVITKPVTDFGVTDVVGDIVFIVTEDDWIHGTIVRTDGASVMGIPFKVGTYISSYYDHGYLKINGYTGFETVITFDGDYSKYERVSIDGTYMVHVSDKVLTGDDLAGAVVQYVWGEKIGQYLIEESAVTNVEDLGIDGLYGASAQVLFERPDGYRSWTSAILSLGGDLNAAQAIGFPLTKEGTYFMVDTNDDDENGGLQYVESVSCLTGLVETVKPLDEKYIPDTIARTSDIPDIPEVPEVPTKLSELENDAGYITADDIPEGGGTGGVTSWNDLTDKPFDKRVEMGDTLTWDENIEGREKFLGAYKVSNVVPTIDELEKGGIVRLYKKSVGYHEESFGINELKDKGYGYQIMGSHIGTVAHIVPSDTTVNNEQVSSGIYFTNAGEILGITKSLTLNGYSGFETVAITTLDEEFLPESVVLENELGNVINDALAQAKASGDFNGEPGRTPVKGTDYYTEADKAEMVAAVIAALPIYKGEVEEV